MRYSLSKGLVVAALLATAALASAATGDAGGIYGDGIVSEDGAIRVPENFRTDYVMLGAWSVAGDADTGTGIGLHVVYAPYDAVEFYRQTGSFPDGTVIVKELFDGRTQPLTTGEATSAAGAVGHFVMVKDDVGRFPANPLWGDGWGWSFFAASDPVNTVSTDYTTDCLDCHEPARSSELVYDFAYPVLRP